MKKVQPQLMMFDADHIKDEALKIRDIMQCIIDACENGQKIDPYARNMLTGGTIAASVAALGIEIVKHEYEHS